MLTLALAAGSTAGSGAARAATSAPAWWSGSCDVGNHHGSHPLGASYDGVGACGPGPEQGGYDQLVRFYPGAWGEFEWECVELVMRYMYLVYGIAPYNANGNTVVANYSGSVLARVPNNGTSLPSPGDLVSEDIPGNPDGHAGVVTAVSVSDGSGTVTLMEQNASPTGRATIPVTGGVLGSGVTGWLHHGGGVGGGAPPPPTPRVPWRFRDFGATFGTSGTARAASHGVRPAVVTHQGVLHVFAYDATTGDLRHDWYDATGWHFENLDGPTSQTGPDRFHVGLYSAALADSATLGVLSTTTAPGASCGTPGTARAGAGGSRTSTASAAGRSAARGPASRSGSIPRPSWTAACPSCSTTTPPTGSCATPGRADAPRPGRDR